MISISIGYLRNFLFSNSIPNVSNIGKTISFVCKVRMVIFIEIYSPTKKQEMLLIDRSQTQCSYELISIGFKILLLGAHIG